MARRFQENREKNRTANRNIRSHQTAKINEAFSKEGTS